MIWCIDEYNDDHNENRNITEELARVPASAEFLLGFNEPDLASQSNIPDPFKVIYSCNLTCITSHITHSVLAWYHSTQIRLRVRVPV